MEPVANGLIIILLVSCITINPCSAGRSDTGGSEYSDFTPNSEGKSYIIVKLDNNHDDWGSFGSSMFENNHAEEWTNSHMDRRFHHRRSHAEDLTEKRYHGLDHAEPKYVIHENYPGFEDDFEPKSFGVHDEDEHRAVAESKPFHRKDTRREDLFRSNEKGREQPSKVYIIENIGGNDQTKWW